MMNIINGGAHADNPIDFQEFMIMPVGAESLRDAVRIGAEVFHTLKKELASDGHNTNVGDEGGFAPKPEERAGSGARLHHVARSKRPATSPVTMYASHSTAPRPSSSRTASTPWKARQDAVVGSAMAKYLAGTRRKVPIISIEDGMAEDDWEGWKSLTDLVGKKVQLVGDDLFVTNSARLRDGIKMGVANSILVKVNQIGSLTETLDAVETAHKRRLHLGHVAPLGRNRGFDDRRSGGRHQLRADQDRLALALRPAGQVQPADPHRGNAGAAGSLCRQVHSQGLIHQANIKFARKARFAGLSAFRAVNDCLSKFCEFDTS
jgi:hypothetical protein